MIVGIIGDTHDRLPLLEKAVRRLNKEGVELVFIQETTSPLSRCNT